VVVGSGILGATHALAALRAGYEVLHLEREVPAQGASVRNFGLVWISGRAAGPELDLALRARELWERIGAEAPETGFRPCGSMTVLTTPEEVAVAERAMARPDAAARGFELLEPDEARRRNPGLLGTASAVLFAGRDAAVEPAAVPAALRRLLETSDRYVRLDGCTVVDVADGAVLDADGHRHEGDRVVLCTGAYSGTTLERRLLGAELQRVRLHMAETAPLGRDLTTSVADANSLRYYPCFSADAAELLPPQPEALARFGVQLLAVQRLHGGLTVGDTHQYDEPFDFALEDEAVELVLELAQRTLGVPFPPVRRRWVGVYHQLRRVTDDQLYARIALADGVELITAAGGRGMTCAPAIAEETFS